MEVRSRLKDVGHRGQRNTGAVCEDFIQKSTALPPIKRKRGQDTAFDRRKEMKDMIYSGRSRMHNIHLLLPAPRGSGTATRRRRDAACAPLSVSAEEVGLFTTVLGQIPVAARRPQARQRWTCNGVRSRSSDFHRNRSMRWESECFDSRTPCEPKAIAGDCAYRARSIAMHRESRASINTLPKGLP
jgi:hypothetical protein